MSDADARSEVAEGIAELELFLAMDDQMREFVDRLLRLPDARRSDVLDLFGSMYGRRGVRMPVGAMRLFSAAVLDELEAG